MPIVRFEFIWQGQADIAQQVLGCNGIRRRPELLGEWLAHLQLNAAGKVDFLCQASLQVSAPYNVYSSIQQGALCSFHLALHKVKVQMPWSEFSHLAFTFLKHFVASC